MHPVKANVKTKGLLQATRNVDHRSKNVKIIADDQQEWAQRAGVEPGPAKFNRARTTTAKYLRFPEKNQSPYL
jgi:hypothetical protein